jgi:hypothetical protein
VRGAGIEPRICKVPKIPDGPKRLFEEPARLVFRHAGVTISYQEIDGHLRKRENSAQKSHISHETWPDLESAARAFWAGQITWAEISEGESR